jgi:hypothetical protein
VGDRPSEDSTDRSRTYRPRTAHLGMSRFCRAFSSPLVIAVDAGGTFPAFTYVLLIAPRVSFCCNNADTLCKRLHPSLQGRRGTSLPLSCTHLPPRRRPQRAGGCGGRLRTPTILEEGGRLSERLTDFQKLTDAVGLFRLRFSGASIGLFLSPE